MTTSESGIPYIGRIVVNTPGFDRTYINEQLSPHAWKISVEEGEQEIPYIDCHTRYGDTRLRPSTNEVLWTPHSKKTVRIRPSETTVMRLLMTRQGELVTVADILEELPGVTESSSPGTVWAHISRLRSTLGESDLTPQHQIIQSIKGSPSSGVGGYRFAPDPRKGLR